MASSSHRWLSPAALVSSLIASALAKTVNYDFNVGWITANPDGAFEKSVIGINDQWPIPVIEADVGDQVVINLQNNLGNETTGLHFHGLYMKGYNHMDGPSMVTQCDIPPGSSFKYNFTIQQAGTYWYHSHTHGQYPDGLRGPLIIHDPDNPYQDDYDEEIVLSVSDWYHDHMSALIPWFMSRVNPSGAEPIPKAALINETQNFKLKVEPNTTYFVRMVNIGAFAGQYIWFEGHTIQIVEVDGVYTQKAEAEMIYLSAAQRCSFLLTTKNETDANYAFVASMDTTLFDAYPEDLQYNVTGWLTYDEDAGFPEPELVDEFVDFDDMNLIPEDEEELLPEPDREITLNVAMDNLGDGANYAWFNNITYTIPKVPTLYTALSAGDLATNAQVYGTWTNPFVYEKDEVIQIVINNLDPGRHPFHLHGHHFQAIYRSEEEAGEFDPETAEFPDRPMRRDTLVIQPDGNMVVRFKADNPGVWVFHCHIEWHVVSGLMATFIEAPLELQELITIPDDHRAACDAQGISTTGNAAGSEDFLDLSSQNVPADPLPAGFTTRGIIALVFSCVAGILGVCVVAWYGFADAGKLAHPSGAQPTSLAAVKEGAAAQSSPAAHNDDDIQVVSGSGGARA
ncbi:iron transport multicopper oxidase fet3 [Zalerion maritima]|uniref:Iron transport multicopper oxidase fet3 n=1 Tax=Zalerion maritima TaxID=339359 RepID=A0AAD5RHK9_9PEZI|nr:iron transport multicopper oxidase fet3 [Zalerion maritima]